MSVGKAVVYANDRHYGDKIAKAIDEISEATNAALLKELEATRAELAAERAKPRGGVAWALRSKKTGELAGHGLNNRLPLLHESKESAECYARASRDQWESVPYPLGDGADELKDALTAKEKAEAEVAAWKAAVTHRDPRPGYTPSMLKSRIDSLRDTADRLIDELAELKAAPAEVPPLDRKRVLSTASIIARKWKRDEPFIEELEFLASYDEFGMAIPYEIENFSDQPLAAMKAAPAEVPPLDKWRVLATANKIMLREYNNSYHGSANESLCNSVRWALSSILIAERKDREQVYPFKD